MFSMENKEKYFDWLAITCLVISLVLVPFVYYRSLQNIFVLPKLYVFFGGALVGLLIYVVRSVLTKKILIRHTTIDWPVLLLLVFSFFSAIFSVSRVDSFVGRNEYFVFNFLFLLFGTLFYYLGIQFLKSKEIWSSLQDILGWVSLAAAAIFLMRVYGGFDLLTRLGLPNVTNFMSSAISIFGIWLVVAFVLACGGFMTKKSSLRRTVWSILQAVLYLLALMAISFSMVWIIFLFALFVLLVFGVLMLNDCRMAAVSGVFGVFIMVLTFLIFGAPLSVQKPMPVEVALGARPSWQIAGDALFSGPKNFFFGSGLGTFGSDFSIFRPASFNYDANAWSLRFGQPHSTMSAFVSEGGILLVLTFVFLIVLVIGHGVSLALRSATGGGVMAGFGKLFEGDNSVALKLFYIIIAWTVLSVAMFFSFFGVELWFLWWFLLTLIVTGFSLSGDTAIREWKWKISDTPQYSLSFSFLLIALMCAVVLVGVLGARIFSAEKNYFQSITTTDVSVAETKIEAAIGKNKFVDLYYSTLAKIYLQKAAVGMSAKEVDNKMIADYVAQSVNTAKKATEISLASVSIWENLAIMYENASVLVPSAREWAVKSWQKAAELEPTNASIYWHLGLNLANAGDDDNAEKNFQKAITLKSDYYPAYASLSALYEKMGKTNDALAALQMIVRANPNNAEALFNLGRLLYNRNERGDRANAEKIWLEAIRIEPNYSNVLFSLSSYYELIGEKEKAIQFMRRVYEINKNNPDVEKKLHLLESA